MAASKQAVFLVPNNAIHVFEDDPVHDGEDKKDKKSARQKATEFLNSPEGNAYINQEGGAALGIGTRREIATKVSIGD
jgi:hypothetical protein